MPEKRPEKIVSHRGLWAGALALAAVAVTVLLVKSRAAPASRARSNYYDPGWDLPDDITQAVANALPHESGPFTTAPRSTD
jgi:hypothetical protein